MRFVFIVETPEHFEKSTELILYTHVIKPVFHIPFRGDIVVRTHRYDMLFIIQRLEKFKHSGTVSKSPRRPINENEQDFNLFIVVVHRVR